MPQRLIISVCTALFKKQATKCFPGCKYLRNEQRLSRNAKKQVNQNKVKGTLMKLKEEAWQMPLEQRVHRGQEHLHGSDKPIRKVCVRSWRRVLKGNVGLCGFRGFCEACWKILTTKEDEKKEDRHTSHKQSICGSILPKQHRNSLWSILVSESVQHIY